MDAAEIADVIVDRIEELRLATDEGLGVHATVEALIATAHLLALSALGPDDADDLVMELAEAVVREARLMRTSSN